MPAISWGYNGPLYQENWAKLAARMGTRYVVDPDSGLNPFGVTAIAGSRRISVGAGAALAAGVLCELPTAEVIDLPTVAAGVGRLHLVALRRTWGETPASTLELLYYGADSNLGPRASWPASYPATFRSEPGVVDDQPLAWVWYNGSNNTVQVSDLRTYTLDAIIRAERPRFYEFIRPDLGASEFNGANVSLVSGTIPSAPAGTYLIKAFLSLQSISGASGFALIWATGGAVQFRHDLSALASTYIAEHLYRHSGGNLTIDAGYTTIAGNAGVTGLTGGNTKITALYLGAP